VAQVAYLAVTTISLESSGAAAYVALPACVACITHAPADTIVAVEPLTVQTGVVTEV
jgi:hypothetical protein